MALRSELLLSHFTPLYSLYQLSSSSYFFFFDFEMLSFFQPTVPDVFINKLGEHILNRNGVIHLLSDNTVASGTALPPPLHLAESFMPFSVSDQKISGTPGNVFVPLDGRVTSTHMD